MESQRLPRPIRCPIAVTLEHIGKKWSMTIIRDMMFGKTKFSDFLKTNPGLSGKVLTERLRELEASGFIERQKFDDRSVDYHLTPRGVRLKRVLYALSMFGAQEFPEEVFGERVPYEVSVDVFGQGFRLDDEERLIYKSPEIAVLHQ